MPAFIVKYDPQDDVLPALAVEWLEKVRPELWSYFQIKELPAPTVVEFFPSHEQFGVRTTGLPWIGTVGASTGNVIALDVPRGGAKGLMGPRLGRACCGMNFCSYGYVGDDQQSDFRTG